MRLFNDHIEKSKRTLKQNSNKGATMMVAIIIMSILVVFCFALMLVAYTYYASQNKNVASIRCAEAANSLSLAIKDELTYTSNDGEVYPEKSSHLYKYIRYNLYRDGRSSVGATWPYYAPSKNGHNDEYAFRYFDLKYNSTKYPTGVEGLPGKTLVCIYWELPETPNLDEDGLFSENYNADRNGTRLIVEVTCEMASQTYTVKSEYELTVGEYSDEEATKKSKLSNAHTDSSVNPLGYSLPVGIKPATDVLSKNEKWVWNFVSME